MHSNSHNKAQEFKMFANYTGVSDYMKHKLKELKRDPCKSMIIITEFDIPLGNNRTSRQKLAKDK